MRFYGLLKLAETLEAWGDFTIAGPMPGGNRNKVFEVSRAGKRFVAKSSRRSETALAWLSPVFDIAENVGFRTPRLIRSKQGNYCENGWTLEPFLNGIPATTQEITNLRKNLRRFHALSAGHTQRPGFTDAKNLCLVGKSGDIDLGKMPQDLVQKCRISWQALLNVEHCVLHADFGVGNILLAENAPPALIDWDESRVDDPGFDLIGVEFDAAKLVMEIAVCWQVEPDRARQLASLL